MNLRKSCVLSTVISSRLNLGLFLLVVQHLPPAAVLPLLGAYLEPDPLDPVWPLLPESFEPQDPVDEPLEGKWCWPGFTTMKMMGWTTTSTTTTIATIAVSQNHRCLYRGSRREEGSTSRELSKAASLFVCGRKGEDSSGVEIMLSRRAELCLNALGGPRYAARSTPPQKRCCSKA